MDWSSWFRRTLLKANAEQKKPYNLRKPVEEEDELLGVTLDLIEHVKSFTVETFKEFPLQAEEERAVGDSYGDGAEETRAASANVQLDMSEWQERHATLVLSKVKELSHLRFTLCPRHLKERQFWRIYFSLVKSHVTEYELQAVRLAKLKRMALENEKTSDDSTIEVEMAEATQAAGLAHPTP